jgi:hypothetical protein
MSKLVAVYDGFFCDSLGSLVYPRSSLAMTYHLEACRLSVNFQLRGYLQVVLSIFLELNYSQVWL